jgi:peptidoglycan/LPS O-acetylase OafA/YrhL
MSANISPTVSTDPQTKSRIAANAVASATNGHATSADGVRAHVSVLDSVRGLAICLILLFHFLPSYPTPDRILGLAKKLASTGWSGVDLVFVLSGLLITEILLRSRGRILAAREFYVRRFLRIMPLYLGSLLFVFGVLPFFVRSGADPSFDTLRSYQGWYWALSANIVCLLHGFPAMQSTTVDLGHFWVLAVIQQFYLLWPLLVWNVSERKLPGIAWAVIVLSLGLRVGGMCFLDGTLRENIFYQTPTCLDSFAIGSLVAVYLRRGNVAWLRRASLGILPVTTAIIAVFFVKKGLWENGIVHSVGLTLISFAYASLIVLLMTGSPTSLSVKLFDNLFLRFFGKYSYGVYVFHGLMIPLLDRWVPSDKPLDFLRWPVLSAAVCLVFKVGASLLVAMLSWHLLEGPCLRLGTPQRLSARNAVGG